jgi:hypothetical protein
MGSWWSEHPDLEGIARRGRSEMVDEAQAAEQDAELLRRRRRSLIDVCFEWMSRGDLVTISVAGHQFEGRLAAAVNDLLIMTTNTLEVAVNAGMVSYARSDRPAAFEGTTGDRTVSSFRAELGRYEVERAPVRLVGLDQAFDVTAIIEASTDDHLLVRDRQNLEWVLPRSRVACAIGAH